MADDIELNEGFDDRDFRHMLGRFTTGVCVVTTVDEERGAAAAITINSFTSVSLEPPLVLFCLGNTSSLYDWFQEADRFLVNVLRYDQQDLSDRYASSRNHAIDVEDFEFQVDGVPVIDEALGLVSCRVLQRVPAGDHDIIIGEVLGLGEEAEEMPLVYFRGSYQTLGSF